MCVCGTGGDGDTTPRRSATEKNKMKKKYRREQRTRESPPKARVTHEETHTRRGQEGEGEEWLVEVAAGVPIGGFESINHDESGQEEWCPERKKKQMNRKREDVSNGPPVSRRSPFFPLPVYQPSSLFFTDFLCIVHRRLYSRVRSFFFSTSVVVLHRRISRGTVRSYRGGGGGGEHAHPRESNTAPEKANKANERVCVRVCVTRPVCAHACEEECERGRKRRQDSIVENTNSNETAEHTGTHTHIRDSSDKDEVGCIHTTGAREKKGRSGMCDV